MTLVDTVYFRGIENPSLNPLVRDVEQFNSSKTKNKYSKIEAHIGARWRIGLEGLKQSILSISNLANSVFKTVLTTLSFGKCSFLVKEMRASWAEFRDSAFATTYAALGVLSPNKLDQAISYASLRSLRLKIEDAAQTVIARIGEQVEEVKALQLTDEESKKFGLSAEKVQQTETEASMIFTKLKAELPQIKNEQMIVLTAQFSLGPLVQLSHSFEISQAKCLIERHVNEAKSNVEGENNELLFSKMDQIAEESQKLLESNESPQSVISQLPELLEEICANPSLEVKMSKGSIYLKEKATENSNTEEKPEPVVVLENETTPEVLELKEAENM